MSTTMVILIVAALVGGGIFADRVSKPDFFTTIVFGAGLLTGLVVSWSSMMNGFSWIKSKIPLIKQMTFGKWDVSSIGEATSSNGVSRTTAAKAISILVGMAFFLYMIGRVLVWYIIGLLLGIGVKIGLNTFGAGFSGF